MIQAIEIEYELQAPLRVPIAEIFAEMGPDYASGSKSTVEMSQNQLRLQLSWPLLRLEIAKRRLHEAFARKAYGDFGVHRLVLRPVYGPVIEPARNCLELFEDRIPTALVFASGGPDTDVAYLFSYSDPALQRIVRKLFRKRVSVKIEFPVIPVESYRATPSRQVIHRYQRGRVFYGARKSAEAIQPGQIVEYPGDRTPIEPLMASDPRESARAAG